MHMRRKFPYKDVRESEATIYLELPYTNDNFLSTIIILPFERNGIVQLEKNWLPWNIEVTMALLKFKIEQIIDLKKKLVVFMICHYL